MSHPHTAIPLEIHEAIIDAVGPHYAILRRCALTCRAWLPRCRYHIFRRPTLRSLAQLTLFSRALDVCLVSIRPHAAEMVEDLILEPKFTETSLAFINSACALLSGRLPRLKILRIGITGQVYGLESSRLVDLSRHMTAYTGRSHTLKYIAFNNVKLPSFMALARLIIALPTLSALRLQEVSWAKIGAMPCNSPFVKRGWLKLRHIAVRLPTSPPTLTCEVLTSALRCRSSEAGNCCQGSLCYLVPPTPRRCDPSWSTTVCRRRESRQIVGSSSASTPA